MDLSGKFGGVDEDDGCRKAVRRGYRDRVSKFQDRRRRKNQAAIAETECRRENSDNGKTNIPDSETDGKRSNQA